MYAPVWLDVGYPGQKGVGNMVRFPSFFLLTTDIAILREHSKQLNFH